MLRDRTIFVPTTPVINELEATKLVITRLLVATVALQGLPQLPSSKFKLFIPYCYIPIVLLTDGVLRTSSLQGRLELELARTIIQLFARLATSLAVPPTVEPTSIGKWLIPVVVLLVVVLVVDIPPRRPVPVELRETETHPLVRALHIAATIPVPVATFNMSR